MDTRDIMRRNNLEKYLKALHPGLHILRYSNRGEHTYHGGSDAVYFYGQFIGSVPPGNIYMTAHSEYRDKYIHRSLLGILARIRSKGIIISHKLADAKRHTNG